MIKKILKILLIITSLLYFGTVNSNANNNEYEKYELKNNNVKIEANTHGVLNNDGIDINVNSNNRNSSNNIQNPALNNIGNDSHFITSDETGERGLYNTLIKIANSLKNIFLMIATIYFLIIILKLLFSEGSSDEEFEKFKKGIKWITVGIITMQIAYSFVINIFDKKIGAEIAGGLISNIFDPLIKLLETGASFFFVSVMIFAFYKIVTAGGEEEKAKQGKMSIIHAIIGFLVIKLSSFIVSATYSKTLCNIDGINCVNEKNLSDGARIIFTIINWLNGFVGIAVVLMIIYSGSQIIFSNGEDEKIKKAKKSIIYIIIGIVLLIINYFILTFFLTPELIK